jgi:AcrR family transcriptional regulator
MADPRTYKSSLRQEQAEATRDRILAAMAAILEQEEKIEAVTARAAAERAGVSEITVYRHFPNREVLLVALWKWMNARNGATVSFPASEAEMVANLAPLFEGFDASPAHIMATLITPQGREMRGNMNAERRDAFLKALNGSAAGLSDENRVKAAAVLQLLYSAYSWLSLREQWDLTGEKASDAVGWAIETLLADLRTRGGRPLKPDLASTAPGAPTGEPS